jgi:hypothetical protein
MQGDEMQLVVTYNAARKAESLELSELEEEASETPPPRRSGGSSQLRRSGG